MIRYKYVVRFDEVRDQERGYAQTAANIERVLLADWKFRALGAVHAVCREMPEFICDDVWNLIGKREEAVALRRIIEKAARSKWCINTGTYRAIRPKSNPRIVWRSLIFVGATA